MTNKMMLGVVYAECNAFYIVMLSVIVLNVVKLSAALSSVVMLNVVAP
jgi:hypothetical protein